MRTPTILFLLVSFTCCYPQQVPLESLMSYSFPTELTAAQDAGAIAWVENREGVRNVFYALAPVYRPVQATAYKEDDGQEIAITGFTQNASRIIYVRGGAPNRQGEIPNPTSHPEGFKREVHSIDLSSGELTTLGEAATVLIGKDRLFYKKGKAVWSMDGNGENATQLFAGRGSIGSLRLSPNGSQIAFTTNRGDHSYIGVYDLASGTLKLLDPSIDQDSNPVWSPDGTQIAFLRQPFEQPQLFVPRREGLPFSIQVASVSAAKSTTIFTADPGTGSVFRSISASNQLFWTADNSIVFPWEKEGWTHLYSVPADGGNATLITPGEFEVQYVSQSPDRQLLIFNSNQDDTDRQHIWSYAKKLQSHSLGSGIEWAPVIDGAGNGFCLGASATEPANVKRIGKGELIAITTDDQYPTDQLVIPEQVIMTAADGVQFHGQLFLPKNMNGDTKAPAVLFFHGGSRRQMFLGFHHRGYYHHMYAMNQYLAAKGYVVLSVNYRSGIGYGMEFREALDYGAGGASEYQDVVAAAQFLQNHAMVDANRIGLWGGSYGGYLTALGLSRNSDLFKAGVDIHGVYDWNAVIKGFIPSYNKLEDPEFQQLAFNSSPVAFMEGWKSPVLLIHGDDDRNVPFNETVVKAQKLRQLGVYFEQLVFPDEVHGFLLHKNWMAAFSATADFFDRKLKE